MTLLGFSGTASSGGRLGPAGDGDRGRLLGFDRVTSHPTAADARAYFDGGRVLPGLLPVPARPAGRHRPRFRQLQGDLLHGRRGRRSPAARHRERLRAPQGRTAGHGRLPARHVGLFYDAPSNPNIFGDLSENGESFDGPPSSAIFAGGGFVYVAPDYLGLGDSTVPRHRYFHAATEASSAADLLAASRDVWGA